MKWKSTLPQSCNPQRSTGGEKKHHIHAQEHNPRQAGHRQTGLLRGRTTDHSQIPARAGTQRVRMRIQFHHGKTI